MPTADTSRESRDPTLGLAVLAAAAGVAYGAHRLGLLTRGVDGSAGGRFLTRLGDARTLLLVIAGWMVWRPYARTHLQHRCVLDARRTWLGQLARGAAWWWLALGLGLAAGVGAVGPRRVLLWALMGRHPGEAGPPPSLTIGSAVASVLIAVLLAPLVARWTRPQHRTRAFLAISLLLVGLTASALGPPGNLGVLNLAWQFLCDLAPLVMGAVLVSWREHDLPGPSRTLAGGLTMAAAVTGWWLLPGGTGSPATWEAGAQMFLALTASGGLVWLVRSSRQPAGRMVGWIAAVAPGVVLALEPMTRLVAEQHRERFQRFSGTEVLIGPALPVFLWGLLIAVAVGAVGAWLIDRPLDRWRHGTVAWWRPPPFDAALGAIVGGALIWRVAAWLTIAPERTDGGDPLFYHTAANLFAQGRGWPEPLNWIAFGDTIPSALHGPGYPLYLSLASRLGGTSYVDHKLASIVAGTAIVLLVGLIGRRLAGSRAGLLAAAFAAIYPNLWIIDGVLFPEGLFAAFTTLGMLLAYKWRDEHRLLVALGLGLSIGAAALVRGEGLFLAGLLALPWVMLDRRLPFATRVRHLCVVAAGTVAMVGPWTLYNVPRFETLVPLSTNGNELHVYSNCEDTYSGKFLGFWLFECQERIRRVQGEPPGDEAQRAVAWRKVGFDYAREHADRIPVVLAARVGRQWELFRPFQNVEFAAIEGRNTTAAGWGLAMYYALVGPAIAGAVMLRRRKVPLLPLGAQVLGVTLTAAYAYGTTRFRAPAEPVLCLLAAVALAPPLTRLVDRLRPRPAPEPVDADGAFLVEGSHRTRRGAWLTAGAVSALAALIALPLRGLYRQPGSTMEEGFMLVFPERVLAGAVPNVDFLHLYGPGSLHVLAGVYRLFGVRLEVERTFGLLQHVAIISAMYVLVRAWGRAPALAASVLSAFLVLTPIGLSALAWNGGVALALWAVIAALRATRAGTDERAATGWWFAAGVLGGLALTYRPDLVLAIGLAGGFLLWSHRQRWKPVVLGGLLGLIPMWAHVVLAGPRAAFEGMVIDPVFRLREGRQLPRPPTWAHLDGALQWIGERNPPWWGIPSPTASQQLFLMFFVLPFVTLAVLVTAVWAHRRAHAPTRTRILVAAALLAVGLLPQAFQRPDSAHFAWVGGVALPLAVPAVVELVAYLRPRWHRSVRWGLGAGVVAALLLAVFPFYSYRVYVAHARVSFGLADAGLPVQRGDRIFYLGDARSHRATQAVVADLDAALQPGERLLVGPVDLRQTAYSDAFFYYLFPELEPATYFIEMDPGLANAPDSPLADEVASADWLILTRFWSGWIEANGSIVFGPDEPNVVVEQQFCLVGSYERDLVRLYRRCPGGGAPGPYEGPYDPAVDYAVEVAVPVPPRSDGTFPPGSPAGT